MINHKINTMKKLILIPLILLSFMMNAQEKLVLTENGFKTVSGKDYIVIDYPGMSQKALYNLYLSTLTKLYISPRDVLSKVPFNMINVNGFVKNICSQSFVHYDSHYTIVFQFKDDKVRINAPIMRGAHGEIARSGKYFIYLKTNYVSGLEYIKFGIWNKKGKLKKDKWRNAIEDYFNNYIADILKETNKKDNW